MKTFEELMQLRNAANEKLGDLYLGAQGRELNDDERLQESLLERELKQLDEQMASLQRQTDHAKSMENRSAAQVGAQLRELLQDIRAGKAEQREILLNPASGNTKANIAASGAISLTVHEMIPTLKEGLGLPTGLALVTGVNGNEVWPVSINDVEMEEVGEAVSLTDQTLDFAKVSPVVRNVGLTVPVSNNAIDHAAFDLLAFVQTKFGISLADYLAKKVYSPAPFTGNKGPFVAAKAKSITLGADAYKNILKTVAEFANKGFNKGRVCISMDSITEAELMATPKVANAAGGFVIENGLCAGYPYTVSHYVNADTVEGNKATSSGERYLEVGFWEWYALQTHANARLSIDATSQQVSKKNITAVTLNMQISMTDLSVYINGGTPGATESQAFGLFKIEE